MTDNPFPTASSSSTTTTGGVSFAEDPRAFYDKETGTWRLEDDDGNEFEYDQEKNAWVPLVRTFPSLRPVWGTALIRSGLAFRRPVEIPTGCVLYRGCG